ncbi:MAG: UDP-N-acetylglucosamine 2-epimerase (non-hydrolyzing) [Acidobacteria bacterium]|nr:UDP-N-acetylglucosamine 2-epimerase (non-hydrolyzing) [Acidobacteriota bacterium]
MKVMTILGTRPEIIRLSLVIRLLDQSCQHVLVHTGQNYDERLSQVFFDELGVRQPDIRMDVRAAGFGGQIGQILERCEALFLEHRPDRLLILGDTNSGLTAIIARRLGIPVYHMEAGNRCFDDRVPEEVNRRVIDHSSSVLMPYTNRSRENLLAEGFAGNRVYVTGNPIKQVIDKFSAKIGASGALDELGLQRGRFFLVTLHRAENVDIESRLRSFLEALALLHEEFGFPVACSLHPRTRSKMEAFGIDPERAGLSFLEPLGFFDFVRLEQSAFCLLSDSGTVQEEACIFGVPNVTIRDVTERPETVECGSNILSGGSPSDVLAAVRLVTEQRGKWIPPSEYVSPVVAETVCRILLSYRIPDPSELVWRQRVSS